MHLITPIVQRWIEDGRRDPEGFWERAAKTLPWFRTWERVYQPDPPSFRWFVGARTNLSHNAVDHHVTSGQGGRAALVYLNERNHRMVLTYAQLCRQVTRVAAALRGLGVGQGGPCHPVDADLPRSSSLNAGLHPYRGDPFGGVRWVRGLGA